MLAWPYPWIGDTLNFFTNYGLQIIVGAWIVLCYLMSHFFVGSVNSLGNFYRQSCNIVPLISTAHSTFQAVKHKNQSTSFMLIVTQEMSVSHHSSKAKQPSQYLMKFILYVLIKPVCFNSTLLNKSNKLYSIKKKSLNFGHFYK